MAVKIRAQELIEELRAKDLLGGLSTAPGRVRTFLLNPQEKTTPHSCSLRVYGGDLGKFLSLVSKDLRGGSGVKVILDEYVAIKGLKNKIPNLKFYLSKEHEDYPKLEGSPYEEHYISKEEIDDTDLVIKVADSMDHTEGDLLSIEDSWGELIKRCNEEPKDRNIIINLSNLRPCGYKNAVGLIATGPIGKGNEEDYITSDRDVSSFTDIYISIHRYLREGTIESLLFLFGTINSTIRRGGSYKNGIICSSMKYDNPNINEYLDVNLATIPGSHKKGICLRHAAMSDRELIDKVIDKVNYESLFISKRREIDKDKNPYILPHANVCMGIFLSDADTCLIWRHNMAKCEEPEDIIKGMMEATEDGVKLHVSWREMCKQSNLHRVADIYLPLEKCKQIAIDVMGVANALSKWDITYEEFVPALESIVQYRSPIQFDTGVTAADLGIERDIVFRVVKSIAMGYRRSTEIADNLMEIFGLDKLERIHTIEPAQSHSYQVPGEYTTCRGIWPPTGVRVRRLSDTQQNKIYYHGPVETMFEVGNKLYERLCIAWQKVMNIYGERPHAISFDTYTTIDKRWLIDFMNSPLLTKYYTQKSQAGIFKGSLYMGEDSNNEEDVVEVGSKDECPVCAE